MTSLRNLVRLPRAPDAFTPTVSRRAELLAGLPLASFGRRAAALAIDFLLAGAVFLAATVLVGGQLARAGLLDQNLLLGFTFFGNWYSIVWLVLYFSLGLYWGKGRTPGKWILGIRVMSLTHERLSFWHALERALGYGASALEAGIGQNRQTVHDRIAETIVVDERRPPARTTT
ncbi:MAG: RDD family protein [Gemmatimonadales bacterium]